MADHTLHVQQRLPILTSHPDGFQDGALHVSKALQRPV